MEKTFPQTWSQVKAGFRIRKRRKCPQGLLENSSVCIFPFETGEAVSEIFKSFSNAKLLFNISSAGGTYLLDKQFISELSAAFTDERAQYHVGNSLAHIEAERNATFAALITKQTANESSAYHGLEENLKPGFFVVEELLKHGAVEGLEVGFHALAHAAEHGVVFGEAFLASAFGLEMAEVAAGAAGVAAFALHWILPVLLPIQTAAVAWQVRSHFKFQTHHTKNFSTRLVFKTDCMEGLLKSSDPGSSLVPLVGEVCGEDFHADLQTQVRAALQAKLELFETLGSLGRCLWPHGERSWSKVNCAENVYFRLLQSNGHSGILYGALTFMAYYGFRLDELTGQPTFEEWYDREFGIKREAATVSMVPRLASMKDLDIEGKWPVCMQMLATHRAFERTFQRLKQAVQVWMRSFARDLRGVSIRNTWWPCQKVFYSIKNESQRGFCKHEDFLVGHGKDEHTIDESHACKKSEEFSGSLWPETETETTTETPKLSKEA